MLIKAFIQESTYTEKILLDKLKVALRVGHHCAQPIMKKLGIKGTIRVSLALYNDFEDIDKLIVALKKALSILKG